MKLNTIRFKISVLYVAILGAILISYSAVMYFSLRYMLYESLDDELEAKAQEIGSIAKLYINVLGQDPSSFITALGKAVRLEKEGIDPEEKILNIAEVHWLRNVDQYDLRRDYIHILDNQGVSLIASNNFIPGLLSIFTRESKSLRGQEAIYSNIDFGDKNLRVIDLLFDFGNGKKGVIQIGTSLTPTIHILQARLISIVISIPILLLLTSFMGNIFALRILKPVLEITKTAEKITHEDLTARVKAEQADEEIMYLVHAFNNMISRLEKSFKYIAEFSSDVAHELKTPLAIIRGEAQVTLRTERNVAEYQRVLKVIQEEAERMTRVVEDLLLLTKLEYGTEVFRFERFDLGEFFRDINERSKILAAEKSIAVRMEMSQETISIEGDDLHLRRLFFNLIDNAIKFSPQNSAIDIRVWKDDGKALVSISDQGIGIREADQPRIFEKFFHRNGEASDISSSTGLGLSVVMSIAKTHHGDIEVKSQPGKGSTFTVTLPLA